MTTITKESNIDKLYDAITLVDGPLYDKIRPLIDLVNEDIENNLDRIKELEEEVEDLEETLEDSPSQEDLDDAEDEMERLKKSTLIASGNLLDKQKAEIAERLFLNLSLTELEGIEKELSSSVKGYNIYINALQ